MFRACSQVTLDSLCKFCPSIRCGTRVKRGFNKFRITFRQHRRRTKPSFRFFGKLKAFNFAKWKISEPSTSFARDGPDDIIVKGVPRWWDDARRFNNFQVVNVPCTRLRFRNSREWDGSLVYKLLFKQEGKEKLIMQVNLLFYLQWKSRLTGGMSGARGKKFLNWVLTFLTEYSLPSFVTVAFKRLSASAVLTAG